VGTPPPRPRGAEVTLPFLVAYLLVSSEPVEEILEEIFEPKLDEKPEPSLPPDATEAPELSTEVFLDHGTDCVGDMGEVGRVPPKGECIRAKRSARPLSTCFFSSFSICFSATLRDRAPRDAMISRTRGPSNRLDRRDSGGFSGSGMVQSCGLLSTTSSAIERETVTNIPELFVRSDLTLGRRTAGE